MDRQDDQDAVLYEKGFTTNRTNYTNIGDGAALR